MVAGRELGWLKYSQGLTEGCLRPFALHATTPFLVGCSNQLQYEAAEDALLTRWLPMCFHCSNHLNKGRGFVESGAQTLSYHGTEPLT